MTEKFYHDATLPDGRKVEVVRVWRARRETTWHTGLPHAGTEKTIAVLVRYENGIEERISGNGGINV